MSVLLSAEIVSKMDDIEEAILKGNLELAVRLVAQLKAEHNNEIDKMAEAYDYVFNH